MKIAIIGYGRMGHAVEEAALGRGHEIVCVIEEGEDEKFDTPEFRAADVAIEFSVPSSAVDNYLHSFAAGVPVVSGTTGWLDSMPEIKAMCRKGAGTLLWASNFSVGVNIFMELNRRLAMVMDAFPQYEPSMLEIHHVHKLDHPSGTAITLAEGIVESTSRIKSWAEPGDDSAMPEGVLPVDHRREGEVPGVHSITWDSPQDLITITHSAKSRAGFALGAVIAAEWLKGRTGFHTMEEVMADMIEHKF
ncbi:MAG: 4-hydroxy-tetrahydrodipicolinate reductase [Muribaculaceae bacterium]|nr:4-hydroxy-tetrahydrodipicolinate reductase [Muribaculaceae bacterium]